MSKIQPEGKLSSFLVQCFDDKSLMAVNDKAFTIILYSSCVLYYSQTQAESSRIFVSVATLGDAYFNTPHTLKMHEEIVSPRLRKL